MSDAKTQAAAPAGLAASGLSALRMAANWIIAGVSLAVVGGFVYWTVSVGARDPHEVPIIRAMEGPSRVAPNDPGGRKASHQGLAVNAVQSEGGVEAPPREVVLAPEPASLRDEDKPLGEARLAEQGDAQDGDETAAEGGETELAALEEGADLPEAELDAIEIVDQVAEAAAVSQTAYSDPSLQPRRNIRGTAFSPSVSLRPKGRPRGLETEVANVERTSSPPQPAQSRVSPGARLIQLGAYDSADIAQSEWNKLLERHADLLEDKTKLVVEAESGGRRFFRLRAAGFDTLDESRSLCSALLARGTPCIPVTAR